MPERIDEAVPAVLAGERLDRIVSMITNASRAEASRWIDAGEVSVDGVVATKTSTKLREGQLVSAPLPVAHEIEPIEPDPTVVIEIVFADADVIVVDKPPGLVVHPGAGRRTGTLVQGILAMHPEIEGIGDDPDRPGIVHRIDKDTSGLLMVARSPEAYDSLVGQLQARSVERRYQALVWGHFEVPQGMIDGPIGRSRHDTSKMTVAATGKEARTLYEVEQSFVAPVDVTLLHCRLLTGRTHQIRVHMQSIGHSVVGDTAYSGYRQSFPMPRLFLHAATLGFDHPVTGAAMRFESTLPADLVGVLDRLS